MACRHELSDAEWALLEPLCCQLARREVGTFMIIGRCSTPCCSGCTPGCDGATYPSAMDHGRRSIRAIGAGAGLDCETAS